jgi:hypothetical protein
MKNSADEVKGLILGDLWDLCYKAHSWTSFSPEKRATQHVKDYSEMLESDLNELGESQGNYKEKFIQKFKDWMASKSNCASTMITGGANFNVRRNEKALKAERNKVEAFYNWREKYFKAVNRVRTLSPEEELDNALIDLDKVSNRQLMMRDANSLLRKMNFNDLQKDEIEQHITHKMNEEDYPESMILEIIWNGNNGYGYSYPSFTLTNNNSKIKRLTDKVNVMRNRIERKSTFKDIIFNGGYVTIEDDRLKVFHEIKPENEIIQELKSNGFRWSPNWKCWCRKHTGNAIISINRLSFIK